MRVELVAKYFDHDDLPFLNDWLRLRGLRPREMSELPSIGFVVSEGDYRIATCFLRRCEGNFGIVDGLASNPEADSTLRHAALDVAIQMVTEEAKQREITHLIAWSVDKGTLERAFRHGFQESKQTILTRNLEAVRTH